MYDIKNYEAYENIAMVKDDMALNVHTYCMSYINSASTNPSYLSCIQGMG